MKPIIILFLLFVANVYCQKRNIPLAVNFAPDPNPNPFIIPTNASTIKIGYVVTNTPGYISLIYHTLAYQGLRTMEYIINSNGGVIIGNETHYVEIVALYGGPDCNDFIILYEWLIVNTGIQYMIHPVSPGCPELALLAESYKVVNMNPDDYVLSYLMATTPPFNNLTYTYSLTVDISATGESCLKPMYDKGAKTFAIFYDVATASLVVPPINSTAVGYGMTKAFNDTILDPNIQAQYLQNGDNCGYFDDLFANLVKYDPDIVIGTFGVYIDNLIDCMHRYDHQYYNPKAFWLIVSSYFTNSSLWQVEGSILADFWVPGANFTDPFLKSVSYWNTIYQNTWVNNTLPFNGYSPTFGVAGTLLLNALVNTNGTDVIAGLDNTNLLTIIGQMYLVPGTKIYNHPFYCSQRINATSTKPGTGIWPYNNPGFVPPVFPWDFSFPDSFRQEVDALYQNHLSLVAKILIGVFVSLFVIALIILVVMFIIYKKWELIFIPKRDMGNWDTE
jgi:hypothetical protein